MRRKEDILRLRSEGKSYKQIAKILGCSTGSISYHCGKGQKDKAILRKKKTHPYLTKLHKFIKCTNDGTKVLNKFSTINRRIYKKIYDFIKPITIRKKQQMNDSISIKLEDIINKFGNNPRCYLTGVIIDIRQPSTYEFDHIVPVSRGGKNTLDNMNICTREANRAKQNMLPEEFIQLCKMVVDNHKV